MWKHLLTLAGTALLLAFGSLGLSNEAKATTVVINNGLAPPNPANVIDASNSFPDDSVFVHDVGCDASVPPPGDPASYQMCDSAGTPTTVEMVVGGQIGHTMDTGGPGDTPPGAGALDVFDNSTFLMSGGFVRFNIFMRQSAHLEMTGGFVQEDLRIEDSATALFAGGSIDNLFVSESGTAVVRGGTLRIGPGDAGILAVSGFATLTVLGSGFAVDTTPVPYGPLVATSGTLSGVLASGDLINNLFFRNDATAQIVLADPTPECTDSLDNDGDGFIDFDPDPALGDPGCSDVDDESEQDLDLPCDDGTDNDGDQMTDMADPGCKSPTFTREDPACQDGQDNDLDGQIDFDGGVSIWGGQVGAPDTNCSSFSDYRERGNQGCGLGWELALILPGLMWAYRRRRLH